MKIKLTKIRKFFSTALIAVLSVQLGFVLAVPSHKLMGANCCKVEKPEHNCCMMDKSPTGNSDNCEKEQAAKGANFNDCSCFEDNAVESRHYIVSSQKDFSKELFVILVADFFSSKSSISRKLQSNENTTQLKIKPIYLIDSTFLI